MTGAAALALAAMRKSDLRPAPALARGKGAIREGVAYVRSRPDLQLVMALVFTTFRAWHSAHAVMRHLRANGLPLPVRSSRGPTPQEVIWREATSGPQAVSTPTAR